MNRRISLELNPWGPRTQVWTGDEKNHHRVFIFTPSKQRSVKKNFRSWSCMAKKFAKQRARRAKFVVLTWLFSLLSPSSLLKPAQFYRPDVFFKLLGIRMRFFVWGLYERLRSDPNTPNKITPESWIGNIYESSNVTVAPTRTIQWYLRLLCAKVWFLYRYFPHYV